MNEKVSTGSYIVAAVIIFIAIWVIVGASMKPTSTKTLSAPTPTPTKTALTYTQTPDPTPKKEDAKTVAYKAKIASIIQSFEKEALVLDGETNKADKKTDPIYIDATKIYNNLNTQIINMAGDPIIPDEYGQYHQYLSWILSDMANALSVITDPGSSQTNGWAFIAIATAKEDIKELEKITPIHTDNPREGFGKKMEDLKSISLKMAQNPNP